METQSPARLMLYAAISAVETDLRNFITDHTPSEEPREFLGTELYDRCHERAAQQEELLSSPTVVDLLPYADFADHFHLINANRALFPPGAASHIRDVTHKLEKLSPIRNRVMHSRPLQGADLPTTYDTIEGLARVRVGPWRNVRRTLRLLDADPSAIYDLKIPALPTSTEGIAHNLPTADFDETGFVGRDEFVQRTVEAVLGPYPVVTILGEGGIGKSAVALKVAYDLLDSSENPFELIVWSTSKTHILTGTGIRQISDSIASSLDLIKDVAQEVGGDTGGDPVEGLLDDLAALPTLLILDNLETVLDDRIMSFLGRLPSGSKVLVTSRIGIGAFEHPLRLEGMTVDETVVLMRSLAKIHQVEGLVRCSNRQLGQFTRRLYNNPSAIKWFVAGVHTGTRPEELLASPDVFLDFCLTNVYQYLSEDAKAAVRCLVTLSGASQADIGYYSGLDGLRLTEAINGLRRTNMVSTHFVHEGSTYDTCYEVTETAEKYLSKHHPISAEELRVIATRRGKIVAVQEQIKAAGKRDPYQRSALLLRSPRDLVPAKYLRDALRASRKADYDDARMAVDKAGRLAPEYFEVHRVEGVILAESGKIVEAESAFRRALEFHPDYAPLLYGYSRFLMVNRDDVEGAARLSARALEIDPGVPVVVMEHGRARLYMEEFDEARAVLEGLEARRDELSVDDAKKSVDLYMQTFLREGDIAIHRGDVVDGLRAFENGRRFWETIPNALIDRRLRQRLVKAGRLASWMVERMRKEFPDLLEGGLRVKHWLALGGVPMEGRALVDRNGADVVYGKVVRLPVREAYGFLELDDGTELFFHRQSFEDPSAWEALSIGAGLSSRVDTDDDGRLRAADVRVEHPGHVIREKEGMELDGIVESLVSGRGFGFVRAYEGPSYFFHRSFAHEWTALEEGANVTFVVGVNPRDGNTCARNVRAR